MKRKTPKTHYPKGHLWHYWFRWMRVGDEIYVIAPFGNTAWKLTGNEDGWLACDDDEYDVEFLKLQ